MLVMICCVTSFGMANNLNLLSIYAMSIQVKDYNGNIYTIDAESNDSVDNIKAKIQSQTGILPKNQTLIYDGKQLESGKSLSDYNIPDGAQITFKTSFKTIELDNNIIKGDIFYYGTYTSNETNYDVPWVTMDNNGYAFSKYLLGKSCFETEVGTYTYANDKDGNNRDSTLKKAMDGFYNGNNTLFTDSERIAIKQTTLSAETLDRSQDRNRKDLNAYVFPMSAWLDYNSSTKIYTYYGDFNTIYSDTDLQQYLTASQITDKDGKGEDYWFRTAMWGSGYYRDGIFCPNFYSYVYVSDTWKLTNGTSVGWSDGVRPAFTLDTSKILYKSATVGGKVSGTGKNALTAVEKYSAPNDMEWKFTLLDSDRNFIASVEKTSVGLGNPVLVNYSGAKAGENEYISAMILDTDGDVLYYGQAEKSKESGTAKVYLPTSLESGGSYTLRVFNEQANGDNKTDYSSAFVDFAITTYTDTTAPTGEIKIGNDYFDNLDSSTTFYDSISFFNYYMRDRPKVTITATDDSNDVNIEYFIADKSYTKTELEEVEFLPYTDTFYIDKDMQRVIVYARLTDNVSHVTYLCTTQSYCIDTTAPTVNGIKNGKTYCGTVTVTISDINLVNTILNGTKLGLNNNKSITFDVCPSENEQTISAKDMGGNVIEYKITVNDGHTADADDGDCTTPIKCKYCDTVLTPAHDGHDYIEDTSYIGEEKKYICSHSGCNASKLAYKITFEDKNITTNKTFAEIGESVKVGYNKGYNATWSIKNSSGENITYSTNESDKTITFTMPNANVVISATTTPKQFNVIYNYISDENGPITKNKTVNYNDNLVLRTAPTYSYQDHNFEFCCWRFSYNGSDYSLATVEQTNASGGTDTVFKVNFTEENLTYTIYSHYMTGIEPNFIVAEPYADENPSYDVYEKNNYLYIQSVNVSWYIGEYDASKDYPSNDEDLLSMGQSQTFNEGQKYTVSIWISLHNEYFSIKKTTEGGSLGYVNPIINGVKSKWLSIYNNYIMTYYTFTAKQARTNLGIASGAAYYDENGNAIYGETTTSGYTNIKASVGDKLYLKLTQELSKGYEFVCWTVNVGDVVVQKDEKGDYIIVNEKNTVIEPTFKKIQYTVKVDILGDITKQTIEYDTKLNLVTDKTLSDGRVFTCWIYEDEDGEDYLWYNDTSITIDNNCAIKAYYGTPVTPEFYIQMPIVGENPTYEVHEKYEGTLGEDPYNNDGTGITWYLYDPDNDKYTELDKDYVFKENTYYNITLCLNLATSGYAWAKDDEGYLVYPKLNGNSINYDDYEGIYEWFSVTIQLHTERYDVAVTNGAVLINTLSANKAGQYDVVTATANDAEIGKVFEKWVITGIDTSKLDLTNKKLTFTMPANAVTCEATYSLINYTITAINGTVNCETANYGDVVTITAFTPEKGKEFENWQDENGNIISTDECYTFTVTDFVKLTAVYKDKIISLSTIAIMGIVIGCIAIASIGGFTIVWFVVKKKSWAELTNTIKNILKKKV